MIGTNAAGLGRAYLWTALPAALVGAVETLLASTAPRVGFSELAYGIHLHLVLALATTTGLALLVRLLRRPLSSRFVAAAIGAWLAAEGAMVATFWINSTGLIPSFGSLAGKAATAGCLLASLLVGVAGYAAAARFTRPSPAAADRSASGHGVAPGPASERAGLAGLLLAALVLTITGGLLLRAYPREQAVTVRPGAADQPRPDVFVILVDTLRKDRVSYFGYPRPTTPAIDGFFRESWVFTQAYAPSNWTIPSVASLFTGLYPTAHGINSATRRIPDQAPTLAEHFRSYGYRTAAFVANHIITGANGYDQGFASFFPPQAPWWCHHQTTAFERAATRWVRPENAKHAWRINQELLRWLDASEEDDAPLFAYVHYLEPHSPYAPDARDRQAVAPGAPPGPHDPPEFADYADQVPPECRDWECLAQPPTFAPRDLEGMVANYDGDVRMLDRRLGDLLEALRARDLLDSAHVVFCADHGEEFGDHGGWFHTASIYEELSASPAAYRPPGGFSRPRELHGPVSLIDLVPTLCLALGMEVPPLHQGRAIPQILGESVSGPAAPVLCEFPPRFYSLRLRNWKLIQRGPLGDPVFRLFDRTADPAEQHDLSLALPDTLALMRGYLEGTIARIRQSSLEQVETTADPALLEKLRTLGYIR